MFQGCDAIVLTKICPDTPGLALKNASVWVCTTEAASRTHIAEFGIIQTVSPYTTSKKIKVKIVRKRKRSNQKSDKHEIPWTMHWVCNKGVKVCVTRKLVHRNSHCPIRWGSVEPGSVIRGGSRLKRDYVHFSGWNKSLFLSQVNSWILERWRHPCSGFWVDIVINVSIFPIDRCESDVTFVWHT